MSRKQYLIFLIGSVFIVALWSSYTFLKLVYIPTLPVHRTSTFQEQRESLTVVDKSNFEPTILFVGDILLSRKVERYMHTKGADYPFLGVRDLFKNRAAVLVNFEAAVPQIHVPTPDMTTKFSVSSSILPILSSVGITHASLANNHANDFGRSAYLNTKRELELNQVIAIGDPTAISSSSQTVIKLGKYRVGIVAIHAVFSEPNKEQLQKEIILLSTVSDLQIAYIHWGTEYQIKHSKSQEIIARSLIDLGIDAIIGHHPHVTQDIQLINGVPVFYSLGNFIFDQYFSPSVQQGYALSLLMRDQSLVFDIFPVSSLNTQSQPSVMKDTEKNQFLLNLGKNSDPLLVGNIKLGKVIIPILLATSTKTSIISS